MRILRLTVVGLALVALAGLAQAANRHHDGHAAIRGRGDGKHVVHSGRGHTAHAHVRNGRVTHVSVKHARGEFRARKVKSTNKKHAGLGQPRQDIYLTSVDATSPVALQQAVWVGWAFRVGNVMVYIWFPANVVDGGDSGAQDVSDV